ncbi:methylated-DNA--[protein]-cysteine S-methyltransferase [Gluconacetobacter entanii]|uniref:methylated-DNA--[protein]-cysteine S-methyltransferase n=1 Tax=Gluconacetobacter entanii TaxID=108528 RepID=UPI001C9359E1|nr:methylated-DNA--[protein]-cysteine S-methyltransferase [Gluconacetobacter entanii]MBY4639300.1 methylated-DNA--[protein]-cysteine S-methyltransferase [Gluconacetobacter entanii]MCW4580411.1 methylated-DNA--[protein]-cysteine S-methyltransferase [Gluconacetobacter entanii]MCW4583742.1 methylated-DNA--[protein]-cysteine S-methyltransferase [Gluconacetobacter entanii]MCW4587089.1 methylated-DNA--[protein]-cysteine S-methyltransferase [Gluconacetobacter entanii]
MTTVSFHKADTGGERLGMASGPCTLGTVMLAAGARGVVAIVMGDSAQALRHDLQARFPRAELVDDDPQTREYLRRVTAFIDGTSTQVDLPLDIRGTAFQQRVWTALRAIAPGTTVTYAELARRIGAPAAVRAVAGACGANALAVVIPCHRVVRSDGTLSGYRWGVARKRALIAREAAITERVAEPA